MAILFLSALLKLLAVSGSKAILFTKEPLTGLETRTVLLSQAILELAIVFLLSRPIAASTKLLICCWVGGAFILYHVFVALIAPAANCPCLGSLTQSFGLSDHHALWLARALALYIVVGATALLMRLLIKQPTSAQSPVHAIRA